MILSACVASTWLLRFDPLAPMLRPLGSYAFSKLVSKLAQLANQLSQFANHLLQFANQFIRGALPTSSKGSDKQLEWQCKSPRNVAAPVLESLSIAPDGSYTLHSFSLKKAVGIARRVRFGQFQLPYVLSAA